jgi:hypothetical protein
MERLFLDFRDSFLLQDQSLDKNVFNLLGEHQKVISRSAQGWLFIDRRVPYE